tara:strand:- start:394 stop:666 length:273 start_codon:yes stop_codon:yes gene_type:complete
MVGSTIGIYGVDIHAFKNEKMPPTHTAARDGNLSAIKQLVEAEGEGVLGSITDRNGFMPVHVAARAYHSPRTRNVVPVSLSPFLLLPSGG